MPRFRTPAILAACLATTLSLAQTQTSTTPAPNTYPTDPANGSTKPTPANSGNSVPVAAPPNAAADTKAEKSQESTHVSSEKLNNMLLTTPPPGSPAAPPHAAAETQPQMLKGPVRISNGVMILTKTPPIYPIEARKQHVSGTVVLHAIIGKDGNIASLTVISGPELLQQAAVDAVKTWVYRPYLLNGEPTAVDTTIMVNFNLNTPKTTGDSKVPVSNAQY